MKKNYVEIIFEDKLVAVCLIKECEPIEFVKLQEKANENMLECILSANQKMKTLEEKITILESEIKHLKGED